MNDTPTRRPTWHAIDNVSWSLCSAHLKVAGLTQNRETMTLENLILQPLICYNLACTGTHMNRMVLI